MGWKEWVNSLTGLEEINKSVTSLSKEVSLLRPVTPAMDLRKRYTEHKFTHVQYNQLYELAFFSDVLGTVLFNLRKQLLRNGLDFKKKFEAKCPKCEKEFDFDVKKCPDCKVATVPPSEQQLQKIKKRFEKVNKNKQKILRLIDQVEEDINVIDDGWVLFLKKYFYDDVSGEILGGELEEIVRGNPLQMRFVVDKKERIGFNENGKKVMVCPEHRNKAIVNDSQTECPKCGKKLYQAFYYAVNESDESNKTYYIEGEVVHLSKYSPSLTYGFPPTLKVWQKARTLYNQDKYLGEYFEKQRPPKGMLLVNSADTEEVKKSWSWLLDKVKEAPHMIWPFVVKSNSNRGSVAQWIDFVSKLSEMQFVESREEMRRTIGAVYGVMPIFQGDMSQSGGLNNEGLQVTVTNRALESGQAVWNEDFFPELLEQLGATDWEVVLKAAEEKDEMAEEQLMAQRIANMQGMLAVGFNAELSEKGDYFVFSGEAKQPMQNQGFFPSNTLVEPEQNFGAEPASVKKTVDVKKSTGAIPKEAERDLEKDLLEELEKALKKLKLKAGYSETKSKKAVEKVSKELSAMILAKTNKNLKKAYVQAIQGIEKELGLDIGFNQVDKNALEVISSQKVFRDSFKDLDKNLSKKLTEVVAEAYDSPKEFTLDKMVEKMKEVSGEEEYRLERIARNETHNISNIARENSYLKAEEPGAKYVWDGPRDHRTTNICKAIQKKTQKGVSLKELKKIIKEEADRETFDSQRPFSPHINCRHSFYKAVK